MSNLWRELHLAYSLTYCHRTNDLSDWIYEIRKMLDSIQNLVCCCIRPFSNQYDDELFLIVNNFQSIIKLWFILNKQTF